MPGILKKKGLWGSLIAIILLAYCLKDINQSDLENIYYDTNFYFILLSFFLQGSVIITKAFRWRTIVENTKKLSILKLIPLFSACQLVNIVMPALTGQVGRILLLSKKAELRRTYVFSTIVLEILFDAISLVIFLLLLSTASLVFPPQFRSIGYAIAGITIAAFIFLYLLLHYKEKIEIIWRRLLRGRWPGIYIGLMKFSQSFTRGMTLLRSSRYFFRTLLYSLLSWTGHVFVIYFLFRAFGFDLPVISAIVIMLINTLALMVPITPGNFGTFELVVVAPLLALKIAKADAVLFALTLHIVDMMPAVIMGLLFIYTEKLSLREIKQEGEKEELLGTMENMVTEENRA
jgi:uncharacterized protein (TIRG00374 family)